MRIFKIKWFDKWAMKEGIADATLVSVIDEIDKGLIEANLGGNVYKKRVRFPGRGKSGSARTLLAYKADDRAFFIYGYAKSKRDNIDEEELQELQFVAAKLLELTEVALINALQRNDLKEVKKNG